MVSRLEDAMSKGDGRISICALMPYPAGIAPSQRARIEQWMPYLREMGIDVDIVPFANERLIKLWHQTGRRMAKAAVGTSAFARRSTHLAVVHR